MQRRYKYRIFLISLAVLSISIAIGLILYAVRQNIDLYYTPSQLIKNKVSSRQSIKLGGLVKKGSFKRDSEDKLKIIFVLMDLQNEVKVIYRGVLPALFREGQGIVVQGHLENGQFIANEVFAKHDEKYEPPGLRLSK